MKCKHCNTGLVYGHEYEKKTCDYCYESALEHQVGALKQIKRAIIRQINEGIVTCECGGNNSCDLCKALNKYYTLEYTYEN